MLSKIELENLADLIAARVAEKLSSVPNDDFFLDSQKAAELLGCSVPTIERLTRAGEIPSRKVGRLRRYRRSELLGFNENGGCNRAE